MNQNNDPDNTDPFRHRISIAPAASGELDGLTFAVKDNIDVANEITGYGSPAWAGSHAKAAVNAICLEQLLTAGARFEGKTKSDELAYSLIGINSFYGTPVNPRAPDRVPGGSSSGSASAVASELVDFAIGTDTGGSIRMPAGNCGVWGYRPSSGAISVAGVLALAPSFDTVGIIARSGKVLESVMRVLHSQNSAADTSVASIYVVDDILKMSDGQILEQLTPFLGKLSMCSKVHRLRLAEISDPQVNCNWLFQHLGFLLSAEIWNTFGSWIQNDSPALSSEVEYNIRNYAQSVNRIDIAEMLNTKNHFKNRINQFLGNDKIICIPTTVDLAPRIDEITPEFLTAGSYIPRAMGVNAIASLAGTPQITIPVAEVKGVPVGLSFIAAYGKDMKLVRICNELYSQCL